MTKFIPADVHARLYRWLKVEPYRRDATIMAIGKRGWQCRLYDINSVQQLIPGRDHTPEAAIAAALDKAGAAK